MRTRAGVLVDLCVLLLCLLGHSNFCYPLKVDAALDSTDPESFTTFNIVIDTTFTTCLCKKASSDCSATATKINSNIDDVYKNITQVVPQTKKINDVLYFVCSVKSSWSGTKSLSCDKGGGIPCQPTNQCSVSINVSCGNNKDVIIIWSRTQQARVYNIPDVTLVDCCPATQTTSDLMTSSTPATSSDLPTTANSPISFTKDAPGGNTTWPPLVPSSSTPTEPSNPPQAVQDQQNETASSQFSGAHIGIIVGTAVAAILITILIVCVIWRIKTRPKNNHKNTNQPNTSKHNSTNQASPPNDVASRSKDNKTHKKLGPLVSPRIVSNQNEDEYSQISQNYNYIDVGQPPSLNNVSHGLEPQQPPSYRPSLEPPGDESNSDYSHLRENKVILDNPYNCAPIGHIGLINNHANVSNSAISNQEIDNQSIASTIYNNPTNQKSNADSGHERAEPNENRPIPAYNYTEINPRTKVRKAIMGNHQSPSRQETSLDPPISRNQIVQQETPTNAYFDLELSERTIPGTYENYIPNMESTPVFSNAVYGSEEDVGLNISEPQEETTYANMV